MTEFYLEKHLRTPGRSFCLEVEYAVPRGALLGILGPSGSGKSTLLRCLAGLVQPDGGTLRHEGQLWYDGPSRTFVPARKRDVGLVFQDYALFPRMTVLQNLLYAQNDRALAWTWLERVRLTDRAQAYPHELSGGERQRTALARALIRGPSLLLLDEPLSALDEELRGDLGRELKNLQRRTGVTAVLVSHSRAEVSALADEVLELRDGRLDSRVHLF